MQVARPAVGFQFPIDSRTGLGYVMKAGKAEQAPTMTEEVVSSAGAEPMVYLCLWCLPLQTPLYQPAKMQKVVFLFHFSPRISSCSKPGSRSQLESAPHLAAEGASPGVLLTSLLTDTAIPIFIFKYFCK